MTTVAMPVFSTKNETVSLRVFKACACLVVLVALACPSLFAFPLDPQRNQGILLGVAGTDIPLQELMKAVPKHKVRLAVTHFL